MSVSTRFVNCVTQLGLGLGTTRRCLRCNCIITKSFSNMATAQYSYIILKRNSYQGASRIGNISSLLVTTFVPCGSRSCLLSRLGRIYFTCASGRRQFCSSTLSGGDQSERRETKTVVDPNRTLKSELSSTCRHSVTVKEDSLAGQKVNKADEHTRLLDSDKILDLHDNRNNEGAYRSMSCNSTSSQESTDEDDVPIVPYKLWRAGVDSIIGQFQAEKGIRNAAQNQGLDDNQYQKTIQSFRRGMLKAMKKDFELHSLMCAIDSKKAHLHDLFPFFLKLANELFPMRGCDMEKLKKISDLRGPPDFFPKARKLKRRIIYHAGPTNSGKTHAALERFRTSGSGMYCAPLRLLAAEVSRKTNEAGVPCDLLTGEERLWAVSVEEPSSHMACTVEMSSTRHHYECVVIDEIQMMRDPDRGWAWTRALLGVLCDEIHVCGEDTAVDLIKSLADACGDEVEVCRYERLSPLKVLPYSLGGQLHLIRPGDCVVAFSQRELFKIRQRIERATGAKCAIVYGGLPPATRIDQASRFNDPGDEHRILVASDAIGMGLNLNIKRIIFYAVEKFDGHSFSKLTPSHAKQIAGRAGRFGSEHPEGEVTTLYGSKLSTLKNLLKQPSKPVKAAGLSPSMEQIEMLSHQLPNATLANLLEVFLDVVQLDGQNYFMCDLENVQFIAELIEGIPLTVWEQYSICQAPVSSKRTLSSTAIVEFAHRVSRREVITVETIKAMVCWPPSMPKSLKSLQDIEALHEICDVYLWLSYRFPEIFVDQANVRKMQGIVETIIGAAVTSNLKQRGMPQIHEIQEDATNNTSKRFEDDVNGSFTENGTMYCVIEDSDNDGRNDVNSGNTRKGQVKEYTPRYQATLQLSYTDFKRLRDLTGGRNAILKFPGGPEVPVVINTVHHGRTSKRKRI